MKIKMVLLVVVSVFFGSQQVKADEVKIIDTTAKPEISFFWR